MTDREFVAELRQAAELYLRSVDEWETAYRRYYRVADPRGRISADMEPQQRAHDQARKRLEAMVPRARGLSFRFGLRDPWTGLMRSPLGQFSPQEKDVSAISRAERTQLIEVLILMAEACSESSAGEPEAPRCEAPDERNWFRRVLDFFY